MNFKQVLSEPMLNQDGRKYGQAIALVLDKNGVITEAKKNELQSPGWTDIHDRFHERGLWDQVFCQVYASKKEAIEDFTNRGFL